MKQNNDTKGNFNLAELTDKLQKEDNRYAELTKRFQVVYWILIPIFLFIIVFLIIDKSPYSYVIGSACFLSAMLIFALLFRHYYKEYKFVDYSVPTLEMLEKAAYRYKPFQLKTIWVIVALLLIDVGLTLNTSLNFDVVWIQVFFLGDLVIAIIIGLIFWRIRYKPIRENALRLLRELKSEG